MAWAQGVSFRKTVEYVTDPDGVEPEVSRVNNYPRSPDAGDSTGIGWESGASGAYQDRNAKYGPLLAGIHYPKEKTYRIDLPEPGDYEIRIAIGDATYHWEDITSELFDGDASLGFFVESGAQTNGTFYDAVGNLWDGDDWVASNVSVVHTFETSILRVKVGDGKSTPIAHLHVEHLPPPPKPPRPPSILRTQDGLVTLNPA